MPDTTNIKSLLNTTIYVHAGFTYCDEDFIKKCGSDSFPNVIPSIFNKVCRDW